MRSQAGDWAWRARRGTSNLAGNNDWIASLVEELSVAIGVVDPAGRLLFANRLARRALCAGDTREFEAELCAELIGHVRETHQTGRETPEIRLQCELDGSQWRGSVKPLDEARIALVFQQEASGDRPHSRLCTELGLEASEARLALRIAAGLSNPEIAKRFGVSLSAVKSRVWMLCRKLGVRNRAAVAALVSKTLAETEEPRAAIRDRDR